jgi:hypothetical protein
MVINTMILALKWDHTGELSGIDRSRVMDAIGASDSKKTNDQVLTAPVASSTTPFPSDPAVEVVRMDW